MLDKLYTKAVIEKKSGADADFMAVASTGIEDRHGEIVSVEGWDLKAFKKNPVLLWAHDHSEIAVGKATKIWVEGTGKRAKLLIEGYIHDATEKARAIKQLVKDGIISTMSVGFRPLDMEGNEFTAQELLEVSFVNVPANEQAMITAYKSLSDAGFEKKTMESVGIPVAVMDKMAELENRVKTLEQTRAKEESSSASTGRHPLKAAEKRQVYLKVIEQATVKLSRQRRSKEVLVIKRAIDRLAVINKEDIKNGKDQRTA